MFQTGNYALKLQVIVRHTIWLSIDPDINTSHRSRALIFLALLAHYMQ